ncbi:protein no-on-transient A-like [Rhagoletis pomonella]|uniref:protein no-on-transient A-like n=1 Tax=Rhagoletis pomonella TaxID=28610 RepID=UPI00177F345A|nr:protein no-on-transient A-like [Rhagoletis pomonella]XP_036322211.1 protein no-on-transient A-like [Rhagoletis pomonella]XP_036322218.1 protein no-on-transient A-like [Rhagoletis pomonella]XP_036322224.1 protein no-on-transient A-like [Rhagoletis pomonella]XP_036322229.1 protein no-on-transient A-like [Rhagoletis pomonella]XP_036322235.1 protein no-on-transient A-like [Rhagoletis pomonella]XP_036322240.1 protein no-on-transient A-like [Rhagoletis pomonella]XP_036322245.1 protein no-on-tra
MLNPNHTGATRRPFSRNAPSRNHRSRMLFSPHHHSHHLLQQQQQQQQQQQLHGHAHAHTQSRIGNGNGNGGGGGGGSGSGSGVGGLALGSTGGSLGNGGQWYNNKDNNVDSWSALG